MWAQNKQHSGFTIVELLIVIVVIGILAAITIVAYNGIQIRAENTKTISAVEKYATALSSYVAVNDSYPVTGGYPCLGSHDNKCAQVIDSVSACFGTGGAGTVATFDTALRTVINSLPQVSTQRMSCGGKSYGGAFFYTADGKTAVIYYFLRGNQTCPSVSSLSITSSTYQGEVTQCVGSLPTAS